MQDKLDALRSRLAQVEDLKAAAALLEWDQETYMPHGAADARAQQLSTLHRLAHERGTDDAVGALLDDLEPSMEERDPLSTAASLVRVARRDYDRARKLPADLVAELAEATSHAKQAWKKARHDDDFPHFAPHLEHLIDLNVQKAEALGYEDRRYDALLDEYEPGMKTADVEHVFGPLREQLVPIVDAISQQQPPEDRFLHQSFDPQQQWDFGEAVIRDFGYDFERGRQDRSAHPFTTSFSISDVRLTTRINEEFLNTALFGTLHEAGHGLYEQGIDAELNRTPLAEGTSLGLHESQSRLWENQVGRSRPFWQHYYPLLQDAFPNQLHGIALDRFYRAINRVAPSLIRVEADEVTYPLHIMLRFEIEKGLIAGEVDVSDVPALWNEKMDEYLGLSPSTNADGVLQDIHWSLGAFGYFPTYALGTLMSAQLFDQAQADLPDLHDQVAAGQFGPLLGWLRSRVHRYGRKREAGDILNDVTGTTLQADHWLAYIRTKFGALYEGLG